MSQTLVTGQNRPVAGPVVLVEAGCLPPGFALAAIPLGPAPDAPFRSEIDDASPYLAAEPGNRFAIDLAKVGAGTERIDLAAYATQGGRTMREVPSPDFLVDGSAVRLPPDAARFAAVVFARLYRHSGGWKVRALSEGSNANIADLGRMLGCRLDAAPRATPAPPAHPLQGGGNRPPTWTGSGFMVARGLVITNAHVVQGAREILVTGYEGSSPGQPVIVDEGSDLALVRVDKGLSEEFLPFRTGPGVSLGETAIALGYPLAGFLGSGPQVTHGSVSGLLGPNEDSRVIQMTTPIQGGSSGCPLLDVKGRLIGVVSAYLSGAQNVNFAVRGCLAQALVEAAGKAVALAPEGPDLDIATVARQARGSVWRLEARQ